MIDEVEAAGMYGRCDECGKPCNAEGCSVNAEHVVASDGMH